jgi:hypothetical protein
MTSNVGRDLRTSEKKVRKFLHSQPYGKGFGQVIRCQPVEEGVYGSTGVRASQSAQPAAAEQHRASEGWSGKRKTQ